GGDQAPPVGGVWGLCEFPPPWGGGTSTSLVPVGTRGVLEWLSASTPLGPVGGGTSTPLVPVGTRGVLESGTERCRVRHPPPYGGGNSPRPVGTHILCTNPIDYPG